MRANQGHSVEVELGHAPAEPPDVLFHGTVRAALDAIRAQGLVRMQRHHVHLSADEATASMVGSRRGAPIVLRVDARAMRAAGHAFYCTPNGVWLTDAVPPQFLTGLDPASAP
ncbi:MAG: RNA 2'-phosphotransferase [Kofleriaceae bacterium]